MQYTYQDFWCLNFYKINLIFKTYVKNKEVIINKLRKNYESRIY